MQTGGQEDALCLLPYAIPDGGKGPDYTTVKLCNCHLKFCFLLFCRQAFTGIALGVITAVRKGTLNPEPFSRAGFSQAIRSPEAWRGWTGFSPLRDLNDSGHSTNKFH